MFSVARPNAHVVIPGVTRANVEEVDARLRALVRGESESGEGEGSKEAARDGDQDRLFLYVCTHGSRDCRCGDSGGDVARALQREIDRRGLAGQVFLGEVAHVGGHKYVRCAPTIGSAHA